MDSLYLLVPFSVLLVLAILAVFAWALDAGQFEDLEREGERILMNDPFTVDDDRLANDQGGPPAPTEECPPFAR